MPAFSLSTSPSSHFSVSFFVRHTHTHTRTRGPTFLSLLLWLQYLHLNCPDLLCHKFLLNPLPHSAHRPFLYITLLKHLALIVCLLTSRLSIPPPVPCILVQYHYYAQPSINHEDLHRCRCPRWRRRCPNSLRPSSMRCKSISPGRWLNSLSLSLLQIFD